MQLYVPELDPPTYLAGSSLRPMGIGSNLNFITGNDGSILSQFQVGTLPVEREGKGKAKYRGRHKMEEQNEEPGAEAGRQEIERR